MQVAVLTESRSKFALYFSEKMQKIGVKTRKELVMVNMLNSLSKNKYKFIKERFLL